MGILFWTSLGILLLLSRAAHVNILWADEDYHLAAAVQLLHGKMLYRDVWYDKPPLNALLMGLVGGWPGWPLRFFSVALELAGAGVAFRFARDLWGRREAYVAAAAYVFFHVFYFAATAIPLEPDTFMIPLHLLAVYLAWKGRPLLAGISAGLAFLLNTKGLFVFAACVLFTGPGGWPALGAGFGLPCLAAGGWLIGQGAWNGYIDQIWKWGVLYSANPPPEAWYRPLVRLGNWTAFHSALAIGSAAALWKIGGRWRFGGWIAVSLAAALIGWRIAPHYLAQVYPPLVMAGSAGIVWLWPRGHLARVVIAAAFLIPAARFTPRYVELLAEDWRGERHDWGDVVMDRESRDASAILHRLAKPGDTLFVWGYRPNVVVYTRLAVASRYWDSQPITMIPADRHLGMEGPVDPEWARRNEEELLQTRPTFIADGLSAYNARLDIRKLPRLAEWIAHYCEEGTVRGMTIYRLCR